MLGLIITRVHACQLVHHLIQWCVCCWKFDLIFFFFFTSLGFGVFFLLFFMLVSVFQKG